MPMTEVARPRRADLPPSGQPVFLLGIAGAGMQALALALVSEGYDVSGSDRDLATARILEKHGIRVVPESDTAETCRAGLVIYSSALPEDHPALQAARSAGIPTLKRARALGALVNDRLLAAVAGTHGKTTVTTMLGFAAERAGLDPLVLVGGRVAAWGSNMRPGSGELAVVEADEYDHSFLELDPDLAIVTSVEAEHLDCYGTVEALEAAFKTFTARARRLLACADDAGAMRIASGHEYARSYGFASDATYRVEVVEAGRAGQSCMLYTKSETLPFRLGAPGAHNTQNAAGAIAAALWLGAEPAKLAESLEQFHGADRRLQVLYESEAIVVIDDYAHHPTELRATLEAVRSAWPGRQLVAVFQPHLFSRTRDHAVKFATALAEADRAYVLPVYPARETPIPGVSRDLIIQARRGIEAVEPEAAQSLIAVGHPTVLLFMGAGDVTSIAHKAARLASGGRINALGD
ncbi:MAG: UDP-N-acetylmuramate--L-alanine ligase [Gemmatimonadales bacterium]|nr:MAG: UDP-N-acetylmuramate--L-alanine ligase [Gemmatimonadales bacterium]